MLIKTGFFCILRVALFAFCVSHFCILRVGQHYKQSDVWFEFKHEIMSNALENSQIKQNEANARQTEITTLLNLADTLDDKTIVQRICEVLDIEYSEIEGRLPDREEALNSVDNAYGVLNEQL